MSKEKELDFIEKLQKKFLKSEVYLVGGAVRDGLLGETDIVDYDFVVRNVKAQDLEKFLRTLGRVKLVGKRFGVFKFKSKELKDSIDIALPRREHALGTGAPRDFKVQSFPQLPIQEDLARRDFTLNAMAVQFKIQNDTKCRPEVRSTEGSHSKGPSGESPPVTTKFKIEKIIDPFNGIRDLENKLIKTVGSPKERFGEDYSRMLRAIRFACQLSFEIEENTWKTIKKMMKQINKKRKVKNEKQKVRIIPYEVIAQEMLKAFRSDPVKAFDLYKESGVFRELMPEVLKMKGCSQPKEYHSEGDVFLHTRLALKYLRSKVFEKQFPGRVGWGNCLSLPGSEAELIIATLLHDIGKPYTIKKDEEGRIHFHGHEKIGARIAKRICGRLKLSSPKEIGVVPERIAWLVKNHLFLLHSKPEELRASTIEKYFFNPKYPARNLLKLIFVDTLSSIPQGRKPELFNFYKMLERIKKLKALSKTKKELPQPLLSGYEIMEAFNIKPSPKVGELLRILREEQLTGRIKGKKGAIEFLKSQMCEIFPLVPLQIGGGLGRNDREEIEIVFENDDFLLINKPAGLLVHPTDAEEQATLIDFLKQKYPDIKNVGEDKKRPGIVHRLDRDVSGLMVIAKTQDTFDHLKKQFQERKVKKEYIALVYGELKNSQGIIEMPIGRAKKGLRMATRPRSKARPAITKYEIIQRFTPHLSSRDFGVSLKPTKEKGVGFTLLRVSPKTGRTHQVRVHLKALGHAVVGDELYKPRKKKKVTLNRIFLHASRLGFFDSKGKWFEFRKELPLELKEFLNFNF